VEKDAAEVSEREHGDRPREGIVKLLSILPSP
jgi:hypothetical protein